MRLEDGDASARLANQGAHICRQGAAALTVKNVEHKVASSDYGWEGRGLRGGLAGGQSVQHGHVSVAHYRGASAERPCAIVDIVPAAGAVVDRDGARSAKRATKCFGYIRAVG